MTRSPYRDDFNAQTLPEISASLSFDRTTSATFSSFVVCSFLQRHLVACKIAADGMNVTAEPRLQRSNRGGYCSQAVMSLSQLPPAPLVFLSLDRENYSSSFLSPSLSHSCLTMYNVSMFPISGAGNSLPCFLVAAGRCPVCSLLL